MEQIWFTDVQIWCYMDFISWGFDATWIWHVRGCEDLALHGLGTHGDWRYMDWVLMWIWHGLGTHGDLINTWIWWYMDFIWDLVLTGILCHLDLAQAGILCYLD